MFSYSKLIVIVHAVFGVLKVLPINGGSTVHWEAVLAVWVVVH